MWLKPQFWGQVETSQWHSGVDKREKLIMVLVMVWLFCLLVSVFTGWHWPQDSPAFFSFYLKKNPNNYNSNFFEQRQGPLTTNCLWLIFPWYPSPTSPVHQRWVRQEVEHRGNIWKKWRISQLLRPNAKSSRYTIDTLAERISMCRLLDSLWFLSQESSLLACPCQGVV